MAKDQLTDEQMQLLRKTFNVFDKNNKGYITTKGLEEVMKETLGLDATKKELQESLAKVNSSKRGRINFDEFVNVAAPLMKEIKEDQLKAAFNVFDTERKGFITTTELRHVVKNITNQELTDDDAKAMIGEANADGDGRVYFNDFVKLMQADEADEADEDDEDDEDDE